MKTITNEAFGSITDWQVFVEVIETGHALPKAGVEDVFLGPAGKTLLSRALGSGDRLRRQICDGFGRKHSARSAKCAGRHVGLDRLAESVD